MLEYHTSGIFNNSDASGRVSYYGVTGTPTAKIDGKRTCSGGGTGTFSCYQGAYNWEVLFTPSQCSIRLDVMYNPVTRLVEVQTWTTAIDVMQNPRLRYAIAESHIYYPWRGLDSLHHVVRKMLPNYQGVFCNAGKEEPSGLGFADASASECRPGMNRGVPYPRTLASPDALARFTSNQPARGNAP